MKLASRILLLLSVAAIARADGESRTEQRLRERLTEREDETKVEDPFTIELGGKPLALRGQVESVLDYVDRLSIGLVEDHYGRLLLESELELEAFYSFGPGLSIFLQARAVWDEDLLDSTTPADVSDTYFERGESWIASEKLFGLPLTLDAGRLDFEDDRLWWWDEDLDAFRATLEPEPFEVSIAAAREVYRSRSDHSYVEPDHHRVFRLIGEAGWDLTDDHSVQVFALYHSDHSPTHREEDLVRRKLEDESDGRFLWLGFRAGGGFEFEDKSGLGYWLDVGVVRGKERLHEFEPLSRKQSEVESVRKTDVRGWAFDVGFTYIMSGDSEPRITAGYARGSGDHNPADRRDRAYRQSGLHANEPGFGGVQRFKGYGRLLEPELSNLSVATFGVGCSLFKKSSLDFVYHHYRLVERAAELRDTRLDAELTGRHKDLGHGADVVLAIEEWEIVQFEAAASVFRAGRAFGPDSGKWVFGGFLAVRVAF